MTGTDKLWGLMPDSLQSLTDRAVVCGFKVGDQTQEQVFIGLAILMPAVVCGERPCASYPASLGICAVR